MKKIIIKHINKSYCHGKNHKKNFNNKKIWKIRNNKN